MVKNNRNLENHFFQFEKIPTNWESTYFGNIFTFLPTFAFTRNSLTFNQTVLNVFNIHYGDIHSVFRSEIVDANFENLPFIFDELISNLNLCFLKDGDLLIADASEDYEGIGKSVEIMNVNNKKITSGLHTILVRDEIGATTNGYRPYILKHPEVNKELKRIATGISVFGISKNNLSRIRILLPPLPEQQKIAAILSTWDDAIAKTQQLINQLKLRNHGLQQQLLSGKKRLKGFEKSKWVKVNASDVFKNVSVKNNDDNEQLLSVTQDKGAIPRDVLQGRVTMPSGDTNSFKLIEPGDFIISLRSFQGGLEYSEYRGLVSPAYTVLKSVKPINNNFYKYYFKSHDFIGHLSVAVIGIRDGKQISFDDFCTVKIPYPSLEEQNKITEILTCTSDEMKMQMQKIEALRQQKKGLMQQLLTGKIRVVTEN